jgi:hypothetical protein
MAVTGDNLLAASIPASNKGTVMLVTIRNSPIRKTSTRVLTDGSWLRPWAE